MKKMSLQSILPSFILSSATFGKNPFQQSTSFLQATLYLLNSQQKSQGKPVFSQLSNSVM